MIKNKEIDFNFLIASAVLLLLFSPHIMSWKLLSNISLDKVCLKKNTLHRKPEKKEYLNQPDLNKEILACSARLFLG